MIDPYVVHIDISGIPDLVDEYVPRKVENNLPKIFMNGKFLEDWAPEKTYNTKHIYRRMLFHDDWKHLLPSIVSHAEKFSEMHNIGKLFISYDWLNRYDVGEMSNIHRHVADGDLIASVLFLHHHSVPLIIFDDEKNVVDSITPEPGKLVILSGSTWHANIVPNPGPTRWALTTNFATKESIEKYKPPPWRRMIYDMNKMIGRT